MLFVVVDRPMLQRLGREHLRGIFLRTCLISSSPSASHRLGRILVSSFATETQHISIYNLHSNRSITTSAASHHSLLNTRSTGPLLVPRAAAYVCVSPSSQWCVRLALHRQGSDYLGTRSAVLIGLPLFSRLDSLSVSTLVSASGAAEGQKGSGKSSEAYQKQDTSFPHQPLHPPVRRALFRLHRAKPPPKQRS
ncbi:hypothetical protein ACQKWADRAFT_86229 [Trichoderma austrokoningii]